MGKVQDTFGNGCPGAISRSVDDIVIAVKNAGGTDIPFGTPVFATSDGAVPFSINDPQDFTSFLGFAVRIADMTPDTYPRDASGEGQAGVWKAGDVMEVLVRGCRGYDCMDAGRQSRKPLPNCTGSRSNHAPWEALQRRAVLSRLKPLLRHAIRSSPDDRSGER